MVVSFLAILWPSPLALLVRSRETIPYSAVPCTGVLLRAEIAATGSLPEVRLVRLRWDTPPSDEHSIWRDTVDLGAIKVDHAERPVVPQYNLPAREVAVHHPSTL
jgi:hypothetical protein